MRDLLSHDDAPVVTFSLHGEPAFRVRLHRSLLVGRGSGCDVVLPDAHASLSREHALFKRRGDRVFVEDRSSFGTFVDDARVNGAPVRLPDRAVVRMGAWEAHLDAGADSPGAHEVTREPIGPPADPGALGDDGFIGRSEPFCRLLADIDRYARCSFPVLVTGETGTGKERVARALHRRSARAGGPFEAVNCGAIPAGTAPSELFGHVRGAFTGAVGDRLGIFERGHGGTVFLDEIGELDPAHQALLLRVLEENAVQRVGDLRARAVDFRLVSATHRDLDAAVLAGAFREDLLYRVRVGHIEVPTLRSRGDDVVLLARFFLHDQAVGDVPRLSPGALDCVREHPWPGNVRELKSAMQHALVHHHGRLVRARDLPPAGRGVIPDIPLPRPRPGPPDHADRERVRILDALEDARGNRTRAAKMLGISRSTLYERLGRLWPKG